MENLVTLISEAIIYGTVMDMATLTTWWEEKVVHNSLPYLEWRIDVLRTRVAEQEQQLEYILSSGVTARSQLERELWQYGTPSYEECHEYYYNEYMYYRLKYRRQQDSLKAIQKELADMEDTYNGILYDGTTTDADTHIPVDDGFNAIHWHWVRHQGECLLTEVQRLASIYTDKYIYTLHRKVATMQERKELNFEHFTTITGLLCKEMSFRTHDPYWSSRYRRMKDLYRRYVIDSTLPKKEEMELGHPDAMHLMGYKAPSEDDLIAAIDAKSEAANMGMSVHSYMAMAAEENSLGLIEEKEFNPVNPLDCLEAADGNITKAADIMGISYEDFDKSLREYISVMSSVAKSA